MSYLALARSVQVEEAEREPAPAPVDKPREHHTDAAGLVALCRRRGLVHFRTPRFPGRELYLARDAEASKGAPEGAVAFTLQELRELARLPEEHIYPVGAAKVYFGGVIHIEPGKEPVIDLAGGVGGGLPAVSAVGVAGGATGVSARQRAYGAGDYHSPQAVETAQRAGHTGAGAAVSGCTALASRSQVATATEQEAFPW